MINIYNTNSYEALPNIADNAYELAIVDPDYGIYSEKNFLRIKNKIKREFQEVGMFMSDELIKKL
jgi:hypothetical protein